MIYHRNYKDIKKLSPSNVFSIHTFFVTVSIGFPNHFLFLRQVDNNMGKFFSHFCFSFERCHWNYNVRLIRTIRGMKDFCHCSRRILMWMSGQLHIWRVSKKRQPSKTHQNFRTRKCAVKLVNKSTKTKVLIKFDTVSLAYLSSIKNEKLITAISKKFSIVI